METVAGTKWNQAISSKRKRKGEKQNDEGNDTILQSLVRELKRGCCYELSRYNWCRLQLFTLKKSWAGFPCTAEETTGVWHPWFLPASFQPCLQISSAPSISNVLLKCMEGMVEQIMKSVRSIQKASLKTFIQFGFF